MASTRAPALADIDLTDLDFWAMPPEYRTAAFAVLRAQPRPVRFRDLNIPFIGDGGGYYALTRHADVVEASRRPDVFSSEPCATSTVDQPGYMARYFGSMINMDDPRHAKIRRIVSRAFTPKVLARMETDLQAAAVRIVDDPIGTGPWCSGTPTRSSGSVTPSTPAAARPTSAG